jgi:hypothetical protein
MPLLDPLNDKDCLRQLHGTVEEYIELPWVRDFAAQFDSVDELIEYIRGLEQRDDLGDPEDGPRLACQITQRARFAANDPNCFERTLLFLAMAQLIDPQQKLTSASLILDEGWHTFPVELRNGYPYVVVLDPVNDPPRNTMVFTAWEARSLTPAAARTVAQWFAEVTRNACIEEGDEALYEEAITSLRNSLSDGTWIDSQELGYMLELGEREAQLWGALGRKAMGQVHSSLRNFSLPFGSRKMTKVLGRVAQVGKEVAPQVIRAALIAEFGPLAEIALQGAQIDVTESGKEASQALVVYEPTPERPERIKSLRRMTFDFR